MTSSPALPEILSAGWRVARRLAPVAIPLGIVIIAAGLATTFALRWDAGTTPARRER